MEEHIERKSISKDLISNKSLVDKHNKKKWEAMVIFKALKDLPMVISAALKETTHSSQETAIPNGSSEAVMHGNMMHVSLVGISNQMSSLQDSGDEDRAQLRIHKLAKIVRERGVFGVAMISCIIQGDEGWSPMRHSFHWSTEKLHYEEEPLLRHLEPSLSIYLELEKAQGL